LLGTYRDDEVSPALRRLLGEVDHEGCAVELRLARLGRDDVARRVQTILGSDRPVSPELVRRIYSRTEGNPFFVEELLRSLRASREPAGSDSGWQASRSCPCREPCATPFSDEPSASAWLPARCWPRRPLLVASSTSNCCGTSRN
jgi:hypothetical protein